MIWDPNVIIETHCIDLFVFLKVEFEINNNGGIV